MNKANKHVDTKDRVVVTREERVWEEGEMGTGGQLYDDGRQPDVWW